MSASRQKKLRQETQTDAPEKKKKQLTPEQKDAKKLKIWTIVFYVALAVTIVGLIIGGVWNSGIVHRTVTAVTIGEHKVSAAELNYFYGETLNADYFLPYMATPGVPLDEQEYEDGVTFADHYLDQAIERAKSVYAAYDEAMANGFELNEEQEAQITMTIESMKGYASMGGFSSASAMVRANYGIGCNMKTYEEYVRLSETARSYAETKKESLTATEEEVAAEVKESPAAYSAYTYRLLNVALDGYYEGEPDGEGKYTDEQQKAAMDAALKDAEAKAAKLKGDEAAFGAEKDAMLKENVAYASVPSSIQEWIADASRATGDTIAVENSTGDGCYVAMFVGSNDNTDVFPVNVRHILIAPMGDPENEDKTYSDEQMAAAKEYAQNLLSAWEKGEATEDSFAELAKTESKDTGSAANGGLYENVAPGQMVESFNDWCFDAERKAGDTGLVETEYGVHVMYFVSRSQDNYRDTMASATITEKKYSQWYDGLTEGLTAETGRGMKMVHKSATVRAPQGQQQ